MRMSCELIEIKSVDPRGEEKFFSSRNFQYKSVNISQFSISMSYEKLKQKTYSVSPPKRSNSKFNLQWKKIREINTRKTTVTNERCLLNHLDLSIEIEIVKNIPIEYIADQSHYKIKLIIEKPLILMLTKTDREFISNLDEHFKAMQEIQRNIHLRPTHPVLINKREWFLYAVRVILEKNRLKRCDLREMVRKFLLMRRYISLYKRKQNIVKD
jgi:hypothetical protein